MNQAPFFPTRFSVVNTEGALVPAASYQLFTWVAGGTSVPQATYTDQTGGSPNTNPIILNADGECDLWLDPDRVYALELRLPVADGGASVRVWDDVVAAASTTDVVRSVNGFSGDVVLTADDIEFTSSAGLSWFTASDTGAALDQLAARADAPAAETVTVADAAPYYTAPKNVENILQQIGLRLNSAAPGRFLRLTVFKASGTWTKASDVGSILVKAVGGGGGGSAGGGGGGGYSERHILAPTTPITVTVGAGGAAAADGVDTVFGAYLTAGGGKKGNGTVGGIGGTSSGGDLDVDGGGGGSYVHIPGGDDTFGVGGNSVLGGGGKGAGTGGTGQAGAANSGGGGSGGQSVNGAGGSGVVLVYEYS